MRSELVQLLAALHRSQPCGGKFDSELGVQSDNFGLLVCKCGKPLLYERPRQ